MSKFIGVKMIEAVPMTAREANDKGYSINANGLYVIRKAGSNRAGFIKFDD